MLKNAQWKSEIEQPIRHSNPLRLSLEIEVPVKLRRDEVGLPLFPSFRYRDAERARIQVLSCINVGPRLSGFIKLFLLGRQDEEVFLPEAKCFNFLAAIYMRAWVGAESTNGDKCNLDLWHRAKELWGLSLYIRQNRALIQKVNVCVIWTGDQAAAMSRKNSAQGHISFPGCAVGNQLTLAHLLVAVHLSLALIHIGR